MASLQHRNGSWRIYFQYKGKQLTFTIGEVDEIEARGVKGKVEYLLMRLKQHLIHPVPPDHRIVEFLQHDGELPPEETLTKILPEPQNRTLAQIKEEYFTLHAQVLDARTIADMKGHWKHLDRLLPAGPAQEKPWTSKLWVYDLRTNMHFTLKTNPLKRTDLDEFVECYHPANRHRRKATWSEATPDGRWRVFDYEELLKRDKVNLDIFWLKDKSLEESDDLPEPDVLAQEIADDLQTALDQFSAIAEKLKK